MVLQSRGAFILNDFHNLPFFCYLPTLEAFHPLIPLGPNAWHPTCLLLRGASSNPMRSCVDEN
jgi:hypothetical protein